MGIVNAILTFVCVMLFLFSICFVCFNMSYSKTRVRGYSMLPTINSHVETADEDGDMVYLNAHVTPQVNDIVVAKVSWWNRGAIIKRLVGTPGDKIQITETSEAYELRVNGDVVYTKAKLNADGTVNQDVKKYFELRYRSFLNNSTTVDGDLIDHSANIGLINGAPCIVLNEGEYFLVGDNWSDIMVDCMTYGPIKLSNIEGKVDLIIDVNANIVWEVSKQIFKILFAV